MMMDYDEIMGNKFYMSEYTLRDCTQEDREYLLEHGKPSPDGSMIIANAIYECRYYNNLGNVWLPYPQMVVMAHGILENIQGALRKHLFDATTWQRGFDIEKFNNYNRWCSWVDDLDRQEAYEQCGLVRLYHDDDWMEKYGKPSQRPEA